MSNKSYRIIFYIPEQGRYFLVDFQVIGSVQVHTTVFLFFLVQVSVKMKQYKDELLASCLTFILSLPHDVIELDIRAYVPALQVDALFCTNPFLHAMLCFLENMEIPKFCPGSLSRCLPIRHPWVKISFCYFVALELGALGLASLSFPYRWI